jgi:hypothetical protein
LGSGGAPTKGGFPDSGFVPNDPNVKGGDIPGIPNNIPRYVPPQQPAPQSVRSTDQKKDVDDGDNN